MKKILLLGGSSQQIVAIETAKKLGYYTILCDYLEDNPGQNYADKFYLVSTTNKEAILEVAKKENISGILAYASDPAAPTAAYVAQNMDLIGNPYESVEILCNKDKFRVFLKNNGFNTPNAKGYLKKEEVFKDIDKFNLPIIVKPVDSSGSKGVTVIYDWNQLGDAVDFAFLYSRSHTVILEEYIEKKHRYLIGGDIFVSNGKIVLWGLLNCHRDSTVNNLVPVGKSYPLDLEEKTIDLVKATLQELISKLHVESGAMNVELIVDKNGGVWPIDIGPRNGGNMIPELLGMIFGVDIVEMSIKTAMGEVLESCDEMHGLEEAFFATHNLHSNKDGIFEDIVFSDELEKHIVRKSIYKKKGDNVEYFDNAAKVLGIIFLKFDNKQEMKSLLDGVNSYINIQLK